MGGCPDQPTLIVSLIGSYVPLVKPETPWLKILNQWGSPFWESTCLLIMIQFFIWPFPLWKEYADWVILDFSTCLSVLFCFVFPLLIPRHPPLFFCIFPLEILVFCRLFPSCFAQYSFLSSSFWRRWEINVWYVYQRRRREVFLLLIYSIWIGTVFILS